MAEPQSPSWRMLFTKKRLFWGIGLIVFSVLLWFFGPAISLYGFPPFASKLLRLIILLIIWIVFFMLALFPFVIAKWQAFYYQQKVVFAPTTRFNPQTKATIKKEFKALRRFLRRSKTLRHNPYAIPWYLVLGPVGSGKSTCVTQSGQSFIYISQQSSCFNWQLSEEALFIEPSATLFMLQNQETVSAWLYFLKCLHHTRPRQALNGILLTLNLDTFLTQNTALYHQIRTHLHELATQFRLSLPVYVMITHLDELNGFSDFCGQLSEKKRQAILGITFPNQERTLNSTTFALYYDQLMLSLSQQRVHHYSDPSSTILQQESFLFELSHLKEELMCFAKICFEPTPFFAGVTWRGIYFTAPKIDPHKSHAPFFGETHFLEQAPPTFLQHRSCFVTGAMATILSEKAYIGVNHASAHRHRVLQYSQVLSVLGLTGVILTVWSISFAKHLAYRANLNNALAHYATPPTNQTDTLNRLAVFSRLYHSTQDAPGARWYHLGLIVHPNAPALAKQIYITLLQTYFLPWVNANLKQGLVSAASSNQDSLQSIQMLYTWLSCYLMLSQPTHLKPPTMINLLAGYWQKIYPNQVHKQAVLNQSLRDLLQAGYPPIQPDPVIVKKAKSLLAHIPAFIQAYLRLKTDAASNSTDNLNLLANLDGTGATYFTASGTTTIPFLFTAKGSLFYATHAKAYLNQVNDDSWILNSKATETDMLRLYQSDDATIWNQTLAGINMAGFSSLATAASALQILGAKDSPLAALLKLIAENNSFSLGVNTFQNLNHSLNSVLTAINGLAQYVNGLANNSNPDLAAYHASVNILSGQPDKSISTLLALSQNSPLPLNRWLNQLVQNTEQVIFAAGYSDVTTLWQTNVMAFYQQALAGHYPLDPNGSEAGLQDFVTFFKPSGIEDSFVTSTLKPLLTITNNGEAQWAQADGIAFSSDTTLLAQLNAMNTVRHSFFGNNQNMMQFTLTPQGIGPHTDKVTFSYDGKQVTITNKPGSSLVLNWPPQNSDGTVTLIFDPGWMSHDITATYAGPWGLFKMVAASKIITHSLSGNQFTVTSSNQAVTFALNTGSVNNPFTGGK